MSGVDQPTHTDNQPEVLTEPQLVTHPQLQAEIDFHSTVHQQIAAMRSESAAAIGAYAEEFEEGKQNRFEGDRGPDKHLGLAMTNYRVQRLFDLRDRDIAHFFARLWMDDGENYHLGRLHVRDEDSNPLVIDWRAPFASMFYRASAHNRHGVATRRRYGFTGATLTGFEDENLRISASSGLANVALLEEIQRPRTGPMRDIVATIQPDQDELIRSDANTTLAVQGAPGTGKTAVGLHRAAWLLYTYGEQITQSGLLILGPNEGFLRYISEVLPSLGEHAIRQLTAQQLLSRSPNATSFEDVARSVTGKDTPQTARLKHDPRMAQVLHRAVWAHLGSVDDAVSPDTPMEVRDQGWTWRLGHGYLSKCVDTARTESETWNAGRENLKAALLFGLRRQVEIRTGVVPDHKWEARMRKDEQMAAFLATVWPKLEPKAILRELYTDTDFRKSATAGILSDEESDFLAIKGKGLRPTAADITLLDEIESVLNLPEPVNTYRHIVIDEAQDLSPMQCRAIARRSGQGSLTVLGDLAQGTTPWAAQSWKTQLEHLGKPNALHTDLTTGYRVPSDIIAMANRLLPHLEVDVEPATSLRTGGSIRYFGSENLLEVEPRQALNYSLDIAITLALETEGLIGVIAADGDIEIIRDTVESRAESRERIELVAASVAKGLEYDHVIVVEPKNIVALDSGVSGLRYLYIAITRAVSELSIVHTLGVPEQIA